MSDNSNDNKPKPTKDENGSSDLYKQYQNFSLREKIAKVRSKVTSSLTAVVPTKIIPLPDETMFDVVKKPLYEASEYCQSNFPYIATVSRSHASEIIGAYTIGGALFSLSKFCRTVS